MEVETANVPVNQPSCRVCGRISTSNRTTKGKTTEETESVNHLRYSTAEQVLLCDACRKFYCRYRSRIQGEQCTCYEDATVKGNTKGPPSDKGCRLCRFRKCEAVILERNSITLDNDNDAGSGLKEQLSLRTTRLDFSTIPCTICGCSSSGFHFGAVTCEGCKGFFRRSMRGNFKLQYLCKNEDNQINSSNGTKSLCSPSSNCRKCRLQRCLDCGMSLKEVAIGRHTLGRRAELSATLRKHLKQGSFLKGKICRRLARNSTNPESEEAPNSHCDSMSITTQNSHLDNPGTGQSALSQVGDSSTSGETGISKVSTNPTGLNNLSENPVSIPATTTDSVVSSITSCDTLLEKELAQTSEWLIDKAVEAVARLAPISAIRIVFTRDLTFDQMQKKRMESFDAYMKCISDFMTLLPGANQIPLEDRITLFTQAFFPVVISQLSLQFDVERQIPNHFSLEPGETLQFVQRLIPYHGIIDRFMCDAGNYFVGTIANIKEFALFCALLCFHHEADNIQNPAAVNMVRTRYELALLQHIRQTENSEERLARFYRSLTFFRSSTGIFQGVFREVKIICPHFGTNCSPLFNDFRTKLGIDS